MTICRHERVKGFCLSCPPVEGWQILGLCSKADPDAWFPEDDDYSAVKPVCWKCPVQPYCLEAGIREKWGMWAGYTPSERWKLRKGKDYPKDPVERRKWLRNHILSLRADL